MCIHNCDDIIIYTVSDLDMYYNIMYTVNFGLVNQSPHSPSIVKKKNPQQDLFNKNVLDQESPNAVMANKQQHNEKEKSKEGNYVQLCCMVLAFGEKLFL